MQTPRPWMEHCEPRRHLAFVGSGASTINGADFQSVDRITQVDGGYVAAGLFGPASDFGNGKVLNPLGNSDIYLALVRGNSQAILTLGGDSRQRLKFTKDRIDFDALPRRESENFQFGISADARRADEYVSQIKLGPDGKLYVAIQFRRTLSLDSLNPKSKTLTATNGYEDEFFDSAILRYDISSNRFALEKTIQIGGPFNDLIQDFDFDSSGNLLVTGSFERQCDFDPTSGVKKYDPVGRGDAFVAKYTAAGTLVWVSQLGGDTARLTELESGYGIAVNASDDIFVGGSFAGKAAFAHNGVTTQNVAKAADLTDGFTMKLNDNGGLAWIEDQGGKDYDGVRDVSLAPDGGVYSVGYFEGKADLDPRADHEQTVEVDDNGDGTTDLFFSRFQGDGTLAWARTIAGDGFELVASANTNTFGDLVIAGSYYGTADFDPSSARAIRSTPKSGNDDSNQNDRNNAYAGFVATYGKSAGKFRNEAQINGRGEEDAFIIGASFDSDGQLLVAGRYRDGFDVVDSLLSIKSRKPIDDDNYREDGYTFVFDTNMKPVV